MSANEPAMDVCDDCGGDGYFMDFDGDQTRCTACDGTGYITHHADECDMDYIADCGDLFKPEQP